MIRPQLFSKELGLAIRDVAKIGKFKASKKTVTFDSVTGINK